MLAGKEMLMMPLFYGLGAVLMTLGRIELAEALPGKNHPAHYVHVRRR
ncbi:MAG: hypothetical protein NTY99_03075 [DPANN group archaeon]|nr:hypothetical protein [DPANN group archaeon]